MSCVRRRDIENTGESVVIKWVESHIYTETGGIADVN